MVKGLNTLPSIKPLNTLPDLKLHAYWSRAFLYRFSFYLTFKFWSQILHCKMNFIVSFVSFIVEINKWQRFFFFWITYCIYNQNIYTFGINQEIVRDICNNRGRSKLLIVSKYRIRTCLLVYLSSLSLQMLPFPTNCLYCGSQPPLLINTNTWTASNLSTSLNQLNESTATGLYLAF